MDSFTFKLAALVDQWKRDSKYAALLANLAIFDEDDQRAHDHQRMRQVVYARCADELSELLNGE
jgi:hypothetical protein